MSYPSRKTRIAGFMLVLAAAFSGTVRAKDFPQRAELDLRSRREGLGRTDVPVLERRPGKGAEATAADILQRFETSATAITTRGERKRGPQKDSVGFDAREWSLEVFGDGTRARYRNHARLQAAQAAARPVNERFSNERLEALGRRFIAESLERLVRVGPNEEIQPLYTEFELIGGGSTQEGARPEAESVVASTIVFTRTIEGIPVVGGGSKIAVTFTNDGTPVAFDFDWPSYQATGRRQKVLPVDTLRERGGRILTRSLDAPGTEVTRFECGLFDPGLRRRDAQAPVQAACFVQSVQRPIIDPEAHAKNPGSGHLVIAIAEALPAGDPVEPDRKWPEAMRLLGLNPDTEPAPPDGPSPR